MADCTGLTLAVIILIVLILVAAAAAGRSRGRGGREHATGGPRTTPISCCADDGSGCAATLSSPSTSCVSADCVSCAAPLYPGTMWLATNQCWTAYGAAAGYATPSSDVTGGDCDLSPGGGFYGNTRIGMYVYPPASIMISSQTVGGLQFILFASAGALQAYAGQRAEEANLEVDFTDLLIPTMSVWGAAQQYIAEVSAGGDGVPFADMWNSAISISWLLIDAIFLDGKQYLVEPDSNYINVNSCSTGGNAECSGPGFAGGPGAVWAITSPFGYNSYVAMVRATDSTTLVQTQICTGWVSEGRSYRVDEVDAVASNGAIQKYGLVDTTPLATWYPGPAASTAPFTFYNATTGNMIYIAVMGGQSGVPADPLMGGAVAADVDPLLWSNLSPTYWATLAVGPGQTADIPGASTTGDFGLTILLYGSTSASRAAAYYAGRDGGCQTFMCSGAQFVVTGTPSAGMAAWPFVGAAGSGYYAAAAAAPPPGSGAPTGCCCDGAGAMTDGLALDQCPSGQWYGGAACAGLDPGTYCPAPGTVPLGCCCQNWIDASYNTHYQQLPNIPAAVCTNAAGDRNYSNSTWGTDNPTCAGESCP
jgi:hypothetical protein